MNEFDPTHLGLESHYNSIQQEKIRRLILEDWKKSDAKLPTYMNLLSLYIRTENIPNDWLKKLSHQTMSKMLNRISTPRYEFWACLHLYLNKKYGDLLDIDSHKDVDDFGGALYQFSDHKSDKPKDGSFKIDDQTTIKIIKRMGFQHVFMIHQSINNEPFADKVYSVYEGASIQQNEKLVGMLRDLGDRSFKSIEVQMDDFSTVVDTDIQNRLEHLAGEG